MARVISFLIIAASLFGCSSENPTSSQPPAARYPELENLFQIGETPGATLAIIRDFQIDTIITYGVKDFNTQEPVTHQTMFQAMSISKPVAAVAAMKMVQDGLISLNEDVNNKLVSWQVPENQFTAVQKVTLKHLLAHRAGIPQIYMVGVQQSQPVPTLLQILSGESPSTDPPIQIDYVPGSRFIYSNEGFCVIQQLIIDLTGQTFESYLHDAVLSQLEMNSSTFEQYLTPEFEALASSGHSGYDVIEGRYQLHPKLAAAGLWTTSEDLSKFLIEFLLSVRGESNRILNQNIISQMVEPVTIYDEIKDYGLGIGIIYFGGETYYWHSGGHLGFNCVMFGHESAGVGLVLMTNHCDLDSWNSVIEPIGTIDNWPGF